MPTFIVHAKTNRDWVGLAFEQGSDRLRCIGNGEGIPDIVVQAFEPARDIFYHAPEILTPNELSEEVLIHVPKIIREQGGHQIVPSQLGETILIQTIESEAPSIPPLASLAAVLEQTGSINAAIVQADNGSILFVRRSGESVQHERSAMHTHVSERSLKEFIEIEPESRSIKFPDFIADEIIVSGSDLDHFTDLDIAPLVQSRRISMEDFTACCDFTDDALKLVSEEPHRYTLAIGAALIFDEIHRAASMSTHVA